ncbi:C39 family peptidase [Olsenella phocaeensis]|uniref:C39 family peptidase n=1 Tax=Olsenella phocaeensis TaxID=1852385 RepID=UPI000931415D|nr:C39 family peptidase [Olsenella phocaeensis]
MARRLHRWLRRSLLWLIDARPLSYGVMALGALLLVLALLGLGSCVRGCVAGGAGGSGRATSDAGSAGEVADVRSWQLPASFDAQLSSRLQELGREDVRVAKALDNLDAYAKVGNGGAYEQQKLLKLAADDPAAIDFVADLPESYPRARSEEYASGVTKGVVPRLYQWDKRWGYTEYCGRDFGTTGCCPTSFSMVYMAVTGKTDVTPGVAGELAQELDMVDDDAGTYGDFIPTAAERYGLECREVGRSVEVIKAELQSGHVLIANVGPGDFTTAGHFIVLTVWNADGSVSICDPYSSVRSGQTWDPERLVGQTMRLHSFKL